MDNRYLEVVRRVEKHLGAANRSKSALEDLRSRIARQPWTINFDIAADTYNSYYWVRNFWKAAYFFAYEYSLTPAALNRLSKQQQLDVMFVGGGSGADALAFTTWFNDAFPLAKLRITVIDGSQKQLDTMARFVRETSDLFSEIDLTVRYLHMYTNQWQPVVDSADVVMVGHLLVENPANVHDILLKSRDATRAGGDIVVIERPNDVVIHHAKQVLADAGLTVYDMTTNDERMGLIKKSLSDPGTTGVSSHYLRAIQPDRKRKSEIIAKYFQAWRQQTIEPLYEIFDANGVYDYRPGVIEPVLGIGEMIEYWRTKPMRQSDIHVLIRNVAYTGNAAVCAFEADVNTPTTHDVVKGAISFQIDAYADKIKRMTGHYGVTKVPR